MEGEEESSERAPGISKGWFLPGVIVKEEEDGVSI